jgi:cell division transport system permease protein
MSMIDGKQRPLAQPRLSSPIVPRASIAGRALVAVVAIMTFLASLTTGAALLVRASAAEWQSDVATEITVQVRPAQGRDIERDTERAAALVRGQAGIADVRVFSAAESAKLLEPWLGTGIDFKDLPVPRVIVARISPGASADLASLRVRLTSELPNAGLDDHRAWIERMRAMTNAAVAAGIGVVVLVIIATIISVSFATRGALATNRPIVEVLHFVGAGDRYIVSRFLRHFLWLGLEGGLIGACAAMLIFGFGESIGGFLSGTAIGDQFVALLGTFSLRTSGYLIIAGQAVLIGLITALASRRTLQSTLEDLE